MRFGKCDNCKEYKYLGKTTYCQKCEETVEYDVVIPDLSGTDSFNRETERIGTIKFRSIELSDVKRNSDKWLNNRSDIDNIEFIDDENKIFINSFQSSGVTNQRECRKIHRQILVKYVKNLKSEYYVKTYK